MIRKIRKSINFPLPFEGEMTQYISQDYIGNVNTSFKMSKNLTDTVGRYHHVELVTFGENEVMIIIHYFPYLEGHQKYIAPISKNLN